VTSGSLVNTSQGGIRSGGLSSVGGLGTGHQSTNLGDILERVLDKGLVIAGDIKVNLLDIELLTIKLRLIIASLDTARQVGINWWESDPWLNADAADRSRDRALADENRELRRRITELESGGDAGGLRSLSVAVCGGRRCRRPVPGRRDRRRRSRGAAPTRRRARGCGRGGGRI